MWKHEYLDKLEKIRSRSRLGGGQGRIDIQHSKGKLTARERLEILFDEGTFREINSFITLGSDGRPDDEEEIPGAGVVTGYGIINGRLAFATSQDFTVFGGALGRAHAQKVCNIIDKAMEMRAPLIMLNDSGGARIEEGISSLDAYTGIFRRNTEASGVIPQIAVTMGPCAGGACYSPAICDFVFMVRETGLMFITGPRVLKAVTRQDVTAQELGGAATHSQVSGVAHFVYDDDRSCLEGVRKLLSYLPQSSDERTPVQKGTPIDLCRGLQEVVTDKRSKCYDVKAVIGAMSDKDSFFEVHKDYAKNAVVGFSRIDGEAVGFVANQPNFMGGTLDINSSDKIARFVRLCDAFNLPVITLVDVPGYLPGVQQEQLGIIRHGAKVLYAYAEATVPKITVILRKAYGGAFCAMGSKEIGADVVYAWPIAETAVMGAEGAVDILFRKDISAAQADGEEQARNLRETLIQEYEEKYMNPYIAAARGIVDEVIRPEETRAKVAFALRMLRSKTRKAAEKRHGNIPL